MGDPPKSKPIQREMTRCVDCKRWWSAMPLFAGPRCFEEDCPCGGILELADWVEHNATLEYVPMKPPEPEKAKPPTPVVLSACP